MAACKTMLEKAVAVLKGGEGSSASVDPPRVREDCSMLKVLEQWLLCLPI